MSLYICSLINDDDQSIPADGAYHLLKFAYSSAGESYDPWGMHEETQPDSGTSTYPDDRSSLIWPTVNGWGELKAMIQWESGNYTELRDQFVRDPLGFTSDPVNTTATEHRPPSPGMQCWVKSWGMFVHPDTPLAVRVAHNATSARKVVHAQFKLVINTDIATPSGP